MAGTAKQGGRGRVPLLAPRGEWAMPLSKEMFHTQAPGSEIYPLLTVEHTVWAWGWLGAQHLKQEVPKWLGRNAHCWEGHFMK